MKNVCNDVTSDLRNENFYQKKKKKEKETKVTSTAIFIILYKK